MASANSAMAVVCIGELPLGAGAGTMELLALERRRVRRTPTMSSVCDTVRAPANAIASRRRGSGSSSETVSSRARRSAARHGKHNLARGSVRPPQMLHFIIAPWPAPRRHERQQAIFGYDNVIKPPKATRRQPQRPCHAMYMFQKATPAFVLRLDIVEMSTSSRPNAESARGVHISLRFRQFWP